MKFTKKDRVIIKDMAWNAIRRKLLSFWVPVLLIPFVEIMIRTGLTAICPKTTLFETIIYIIMLILYFPNYFLPFVFGLSLMRNEKISCKQYFTAWKDILSFNKNSIYFKVFKTFTWGMIKVILWSLLFILPGIYFAIKYSMAEYIQIDNPNMTSSKCLEASSQLMDGHVWDFILFTLSFILWIIGTFVTLGLASFLFFPYNICAQAGFYEWLRKNETIDYQ